LYSRSSQFLLVHADRRECGKAGRRPRSAARPRSHGVDQRLRHDRSGETVLDESLRVLGAEHPHTLAARDCVAWWRGMAQGAAAALAGYGALRADTERLLGPEHPTTLDIRGTLAPGPYLLPCLHHAR
jgi:hypothetical protein